MTREEANSCIKTVKLLRRLALNIHGVIDVVDDDNCNKIISALEQQPCEDAVSRDAVCDYIAEYVNNEYSTQAECEMVDYMIDGIQHLPSVTVRQIDNHLLDGIHAMGYREGHKDAKVEYERQTGEWLEKEVCNDKDNGIDAWQSAKCSKCGKYHTTPYMYYFDNYEFCPKCGARMVEPQESEDKDEISRKNS